MVEGVADRRRDFVFDEAGDGGFTAETVADFGDDVGGALGGPCLGGVQVGEFAGDLGPGEGLGNLTRKSVSGHRARLGTYPRDGSALMVVAVGAGQSFRLIVTSFGDGAPKGPGTVGLAEEFAEAIVSHLRRPVL